MVKHSFLKTKLFSERDESKKIQEWKEGQDEVSSSSRHSLVSTQFQTASLHHAGLIPGGWEVISEHRFGSQRPTLRLVRSPVPPWLTSGLLSNRPHVSVVCLPAARRWCGASMGHRAHTASSPCCGESDVFSKAQWLVYF